MHGKKRAEYKARLNDAKTAAALESKAEQWHALMKELQNRRQNQQKNNDTTTLALLEKALLVNPDPLNLWNHRRELLLQCPEGEEEKKISATRRKELPLLETELALTQAALQRNAKSYGAWFHRKWVMQHVRPSHSVLQQELVLTAQFLSMDERNFHCWNYRRFVVACLAGSWNGEWKVSLPVISLMGPQISSIEDYVSSNAIIVSQNILQSEFDFTFSKIKDNFSNFSAFHYRGQLLEAILGASDDAAKDSIAEQRMLEEFQLMEDAICTEPDDQTSWWYHASLLDKIQQDKTLLASMQMRLKEQAGLFRELLEDSPGKWVMLGLFRVLQLLSKSSASDETMTSDDNTRVEQETLLHRLAETDPDRSQRYQELLQQL